MISRITFRLFLLAAVTANVSLILYGALVLVVPGILLEPFIQYVYTFPTDAAQAVAYMAALFRLLGFFNIFPGAIGLVLLCRLVLFREMWARRVVTVTTGLAYVGPIVFDNTVGTIGFFEIVEHILFVAVIVLGLLTWRYQDAFQ